MNKIILAFTSLLVVFSVSSHAELTNHFVKQAQKKEHATVSMNQSAQSSFKTEILNVDPRITNK